MRTLTASSGGAFSVLAILPSRVNGLPVMARFNRHVPDLIPLFRRVYAEDCSELHKQSCLDTSYYFKDRLSSPLDPRRMVRPGRLSGPPPKMHRQ